MGVLESHRISVPVIVVGNISVGGTGKTPMVTFLVSHLRSLGFHPGVVSRGYGGNATHWPQSVNAKSDVLLVGDEAVLIAAQCACPMVVGPDRTAAVNQLLENYDCDIVISDDGLQHYALGRDLEIVIIDEQRQFGNGFCLPAGPLRERPSRLNEVELIIYNGGQGRGAMRLHIDQAFNLVDDTRCVSLEEFVGQSVHAVAGIGNPQRFFQQLRAKGLLPIEHPFPDHYMYRPDDLKFGDESPILMTEKDAIKCRDMKNQKLWRVPVSIDIAADVIHTLDKRLKEIHG